MGEGKVKFYDVVDSDGELIRTYDTELNGENALGLAKEFAKKKGYKVKGLKEEKVEDDTTKPYSEMGLAELKDVAKAFEIDVKGLKSKADFIKAIEDLQKAK